MQRPASRALVSLLGLVVIFATGCRAPEVEVDPGTSPETTSVASSTTGTTTQVPTTTPAPRTTASSTTTAPQVEPAYEPPSDLETRLAEAARFIDESNLAFDEVIELGAFRPVPEPATACEDISTYRPPHFLSAAAVTNPSHSAWFELAGDTDPSWFVALVVYDTVDDAQAVLTAVAGVPDRCPAGSAEIAVTDADDNPVLDENGDPIVVELEVTSRPLDGDLGFEQAGFLTLVKFGGALGSFDIAAYAFRRGPLVGLVWGDSSGFYSAAELAAGMAAIIDREVG